MLFTDNSFDNISTVKISLRGLNTCNIIKQFIRTFTVNVIGWLKVCVSWTKLDVMKINVDTNNNTWSNLNDTQNAHTTNSLIMFMREKRQTCSCLTGDFGEHYGTVNNKMIPIWGASKSKRLNQSSLMLRSCWHKVGRMITSVWVFALSDVEIALDASKPCNECNAQCTVK